VFLPASGELHHRHLGQTLRLSVLYPLLQMDSTGASSPRRSVAGFPSGSADSGRLRARCLAEFSPGTCYAILGGRGVCVHAGGSAEVRCSWCAR
jgi:hypothetical protein